MLDRGNGIVRNYGPDGSVRWADDSLAEESRFVDWLGAGTVAFSSSSEFWDDPERADKVAYVRQAGLKRTEIAHGRFNKFRVVGWSDGRAPLALVSSNGGDAQVYGLGPDGTGGVGIGAPLGLVDFFRSPDGRNGVAYVYARNAPSNVLGFSYASESGWSLDWRSRRDQGMHSGCLAQRGAVLVQITESGPLVSKPLDGGAPASAIPTGLHRVTECQVNSDAVLLLERYQSGASFSTRAELWSLDKAGAAPGSLVGTFEMPIEAYLRLGDSGHAVVVAAAGSVCAAAAGRELGKASGVDGAFLDDQVWWVVDADGVARLTRLE